MRLPHNGLIVHVEMDPDALDALNATLHSLHPQPGEEALIRAIEAVKYTVRNSANIVAAFRSHFAD